MGFRNSVCQSLPMLLTSTITSFRGAQQFRLRNSKSQESRRCTVTTKPTEISRQGIFNNHCSNRPSHIVDSKTFVNCSNTNIVFQRTPRLTLLPLRNSDRRHPCAAILRGFMKKKKTMRDHCRLGVGADPYLLFWLALARR